MNEIQPHEIRFVSFVYAGPQNENAIYGTICFISVSFELWKSENLYTQISRQTKKSKYPSGHGNYLIA